MNRDDKQEFVSSFTDAFAKAQAAFLIDYQGCSCDEINGIRKKLLANDSRMLVVKNTLAKRVVQDLEAGKLVDFLKGPTAVVLAQEDPVAPAKVLSDFAKTKKDAFKVKAGWVDGEVISANDVGLLAAMPSKLELQAKLLALISAPATQLVGVINAPARNVACLLGAWQTELEKSG